MYRFNTRGAKRAFWDVNLSIEQGECVVLTGGVRLWENDSDQIDERSRLHPISQVPFPEVFV